WGVSSLIHQILQRQRLESTRNPAQSPSRVHDVRASAPRGRRVTRFASGRSSSFLALSGTMGILPESLGFLLFSWLSVQVGFSLDVRKVVSSLRRLFAPDGTPRPGDAHGEHISSGQSSVYLEIQWWFIRYPQQEEREQVEEQMFMQGSSFRERPGSPEMNVSRRYWPFSGKVSAL
ncbi:hypothetical protein DNTS_004438, partial [Danionella cerebrum]